MSSASRQDTRKILMRTAATALIAASPFVYSGASAAATTTISQLTAPTLKSGTQASSPLLYSVSAGNFQLTAPIFQGGKIANDSLLFANNFNLSAPTLQGANTFAASRLASQPVQNLLAVPMDAQAGEATISASAFSISTMATGTVTYDNSNDITVSDAETAIEVDGGTDHVVVNNTGDLTGGGGINVSTSDFDGLNAEVWESNSFTRTSYYSAPLFTDTGEPVTAPCYWDPGTECQLSAVYAKLTGTYNTTVLNGTQTDAQITINNGGDINFSYLRGINAENEAGAGIAINNTGDISSTQDTAGRAGIRATTDIYYFNSVADGPNVVVEGEYTVIPGPYPDSTWDDKLTGVTTIQERERTESSRVHGNDLGSIQISNAGTIDMGFVDVSEIPSGYVPAYTQSVGIYARGFGGIDIVNQASGTIKVGDFSDGITAISGGDVTIQNDGRIEIGNRSHGILAIAVNQPSGDIYAHGGDTTIINTGDIVGGMTKAEAEASPNHNAFGGPDYFTGETYLVGSAGIRVDNLGTNADGSGRYIHAVENLQMYGFDVKLTDPEFRPYLPGDPAPPAELTDPKEIEEWWDNFVPKLENFTTTIVNLGNIDLKDGAAGIHATAVYGEIRAYNGGTIKVGNGDSRFGQNTDARSAGIYMNNNPSGGLADFYAKNEAGGIIVTGDDGVGIQLKSAGGSATAINEGSITVGNGGLGDRTNNETEETYDWLFPSIGMSAITAGISIGQTAIAVNSGIITTGDLSIGIHVAGNNATQTFETPLLPTRTTAYLINEGTVTTGDNATGLSAYGNSVLVANRGSVTIGDHDLSGFDLPPPDTGGSHYFNQMGYGIIAKSSLFGTVYNIGSVTTGDNTVGIYNGVRDYYGGLGIYTLQGEDGVVTTGDASTGIKSHAGHLTYLDNAGRVSVGNDSIGVDMSAGFVGVHSVSGPGYPAVEVVPGQVLATNSGIIETGDNSTGIRLRGVIEDAPYDAESYYVFSRDPLSYEYRQYTGTADIVGEVNLYNSGTIRVGANSTAVEISGKGLSSPIANPDFDPENPIGQPYLPNPNYDPTDVNSEPYLTTEPLPQLINTGTIDAGRGIAIKANVDNGIHTKIDNSGTIIGDILLGAGNDNLRNHDGGNIVMNDSTIDFGEGENKFVINSAAISVAGGDDNVITGSNLTVEMDYGQIDARDMFVGGPISLVAAAPLAAPPFSTLTIDGNVSGSFRFAADVNAAGQSDELIITGDVADGSEIGVVVNLLDPFKGDLTFAPIHIDGSNGADLLEVAGASGFYADSFVGGEAHFDQASGDVIVTATFGMGHMATAANAAAIGAQNWLSGSLSSYGHRNIQAYTGRKGEGLAVWGYAFQDEGRIHPDSDLQELSFSEISSGFQAGVQWSQDIAGGRVSVSPMFTYGTVEANLRVNNSSSRGHPWAVGLNANYAQENGLYVDATYQRMRMDVDFKTHTITNATGETKVDGQGFNLEAGYSHKLKSGLTIEPQLQLTHTNVDMGDFASSDGIYNFSDVNGKATTLRAGLSAYKMFETANGSITPMASLSYLGAFNGKTELVSNGLDFDSDISGSGYKAEIGLLGRYMAWDFAGKLGVSNTSATGSILQPSLTVRYGFGGAGKTPVKSAGVPELPEVTEATVKFAEAGNVAAAPMATAASAEDGAPVVSAAYAQTGAEPSAEKEKTEGQPEQASPELNAEQAAPNPMDPAAEPAADEEADEISDIVVTGTLIRRSTAMEATPITVVTSEEMAARGLMNLGEVMQSFTQNEGYVQGKASNLLGRFTFGAEEINFRGLGAGRTLVLVNGRRIADYPLPFGGEQNGVDLGTIPFTAIAKVEYLSAGASATYGSDAVGGVVNIITKRDMEQTLIEGNIGAYQQGYGKTARLAAITGNSFERGSFTVGVEGYYAGEILASDVKWLRKNAPYNVSMVDLVEFSNAGTNLVVPEDACAPLGFDFDPAGACTSEVSDTISIYPTVKQGSAFFDGRYDLTDRIELFGTAMASIASQEVRSNILFWQGVVADLGPDGVIGDENFSDDGNVIQIQRGFSEDELGVSKVNVDNKMWTATVGAKGGIDVKGGTWYWDVALSHADYNTKTTSMNLKEEGVRDWILNGAETAIDFTGQRYTYFVDSDFYNNQLIDNVVRPVQSSDVDSLVGKNIMKANSSAQSLTATLNGTFGDLGFLYKPVKFAVRAEYGRQVTEINPDERTLNTSGEGWYGIGSIEAKGKRSRWAVAAEVDASVLSNLDIVLAGRYDHYYDDSSIKGRFTGQAKFLYRPTDWLKIRGGYGQTFRAPDMFNLYGRSDGFEIVPDYSAEGCFDGSTYVCRGFQVSSSRQADVGLTEEHGDDLGLGFILNPFPGLQLTADWYTIHLKDLVVTESSSELLLKEWQCDNDELDGSSLLCADIKSRVIRNELNGIEQVIIRPINQSKLTRSGFDIQASYSYESEKLGAFNFNFGYSKVLKFELTRFAGDDALDLKYGQPGLATPGNNMNFGLSWSQPLTAGKAIAAGLFVQRTGRVYNFDQTQFMEPFYDVNLSAAYQLNAKTSLRLNVNNLLNAEPQPNGSGFWPFYWEHLQTANALGRSAYLSFGYSFK